MLTAYPLETWTFRIVHVIGALALTFALFACFSFRGPDPEPDSRRRGPVDWALSSLGAAALVASVWALGVVVWIWDALGAGALRIDPEIETFWFGVPLLASAGLGILVGWLQRGPRGRTPLSEWALAVAAIASGAYLTVVFAYPNVRAMTDAPAFAPIGISFAATASVALILEATRRLAGLALVIIAGVFLAYAVGPELPAPFTNGGLSWKAVFSKIYTDFGVLGPTTAVSSTYIILFIIFAAVLQASRVGGYFVELSYALAGRARGGPAKVAIFSSGLMGTINGTSAGNVVATGAFTIPLMRRVGYPAQSAGAVEAAASAGGQILPPIMGAGAFIMAEITGVNYLDIAVAALIPAALYFLSVYFTVDFKAGRLGLTGMRAEDMPKLAAVARRSFLLLPICVLIGAMVLGYSPIRAGALATASAAVVSWLTPYRMTPLALYRAFARAGEMALQIIAVCACAGVIVGAIVITKLDQTLSQALLGAARDLSALIGQPGLNQLFALVFAMVVSIVLGMGMPTTAAYAIAGSVVAPGLEGLGFDKLTAHLFVFYYAVLSAITPPVALAAYAAAGISGANPMRTSITAFQVGLAAFIVPFMFAYNGALLAQGDWLEVARALATACVGVYLLAGAVEGWMWGARLGVFARFLAALAALFMIEGGLLSDAIGLGLAAASFALARLLNSGAARPSAGGL